MAGRQQPYNPALSGPQARLDDLSRHSEAKAEAERSRVHDRRATQINRGSAGHIVEAEVEDPYEPGARISTVRSVRDDPLADHLARGHIDEAQYLAGREFQRHFGLAERGPRAMQMAEAVDGSPARETLTDEQLRARKWLTRCYGALGRDGSTIVYDVLIQGRTARQIAASRGLVGNQEWDRFISRFFYECLDTLAVVFGFSNGVRHV